MWWLLLPGSKRCKVAPSGVLAGRSSQCDVVLTDPSASRLQAIVFLGADTPCLNVLGKGRVDVNGEPVSGRQVLADGDAIALTGLELTVRGEIGRGEAAPGWGWVLSSSSGGMFGLAQTPFTIGGGPHADLRIDGWPEPTMRFHVVSGKLCVEAVDAIELDDDLLEPGQIETVSAGMVLGYRGERFSVLAGGALSGATTASGGHGPAVPLDRVHLEFLPRGGRLSVQAGGDERCVYLPDRRCDLVAALLSPPPPYQPGDLIPDEILLPRIWPNQPMTRVNLNVLLHRARRDLVRAELDGPELLQRAPGGSATRFLVLDGTEVVVE